ncbi:hypothetical protein PLESTB_000661600 [Pleodorina starrii]|uniref:Uncharacterized protein n=1 Tax=Pleodorina starrii TaxID=330485 RepID=A0A9W6BIQ5_9CHLO|nr:hypothetical protein PLESTM_001319000 [Pleodorina starrii]GLC52728.1 hypothetical protein PLESTB_000661600 [Pleodorina starrii]
MERWTDIGPLLQAARADLKVGELLAGEAFSLFEAMSALEAGNPKMDAAASPSAERPTLDALRADPDVAPWDLPASKLGAVLDQLLAMEASWHCGGSAMQTVYACLYMLKLDRAQEHDSPVARALYAYCRTLQYDCALVRDLVMTGAVCEEEDINVFTGGIPFEPPADGAAAALAALDAAITAAAVGAAVHDGGAAAASTSGTDTAATPAPLGEAIALRLRLRRALHLGLKQAASEDPKEVGGAAAHFQEALALLKQMRESLAADTAADTASSVSYTPAEAAASAASSSAAAAATSSSSSAAAAAAAAAARLESLGFHVDVNRHLLGPAPPRQVKVLAVSEALSYMERMAEHLQLAVSVSEHVHDYRSLQLFMWRMSRMRPGAVARSLMHSLILPDRWKASPAPSSSSSSSGGGGGSAQADGAAAASASSQNGAQQQQAAGAGAAAARGGGRKGGRKGQGGAAAAVGKNGASTSSDPQSQAEAAAAAAATPAWVPTKEMIAGACRVPYKAGLPEEAELFFEQALIAASNVFQAMLMNRCRSRRRLRRCLDDWLNMYHHGFNADLTPAFREALRGAGWRWRWGPTEGQAPEEEQGPLSTWVEVQTALTQLHHLLMGFELELYEPLEYDMIYWYCDYLCTCAVGAYSVILQRCPPPKPPQPPPPQSHSPAGGAGLGRGLGRGRGLGAAGGGRDPAAAAAAAAAAMAKYEREQAQLRYEVCEVEALQQLCQGMLRLMAGLRMAGAVPEPRSPPPFNGGAQRFEQRFASFSQLVRPPPLTHSDYLASMDPGSRDATFLLRLAVVSFREARLRCTALKTFAPSPDVAAGWVRGLERVAATNAVVAGVLEARLAEAAGGGGGKVKWECDWSLHPYFPAVALPKPAPAAAATASSSSSSAATATSTSSTSSAPAPPAATPAASG